MRYLAAVAVLCLSLLASKAQASGVTPFSIGGSSTTSLVILSAVPRTFWGISMSSAAAGDLFKCWNSSSTSGLSFATAPTLGGTHHETTANESQGPASVAVNASVGVVCAKNSTSAEILVYLTAP